MKHWNIDVWAHEAELPYLTGHVFMQELEFNGPPKYFTPDWQAAQASLLKLAKLKPKLAITGHGQPVEGDVLSAGLQQLCDDFERIAMPH